MPDDRRQPGEALRPKLAITVIVAARNEALNLPRCLAALRPAERVIVADSQSTDETVQIALSMGAEVKQFSYSGGYPKKRQWVLDNGGLSTPWIMMIDADEVTPNRLWSEIEAVIDADGGHSAYLVKKEFHFLGRRFRYGGFSHEAVVLFRRGSARFENLLDNPPLEQDMEVHERLIVDGTIGRMATPLIHEDFKGLDHYVNKHRQYASWEAAVRLAFFRHRRWGRDSIDARVAGNTQEARRFLKLLAIRTPCEPTLWFLYHYLVRLGFLEGRRGFIASQIRSNYIREVRAKIYEMRLKGDSPMLGG